MGKRKPKACRLQLAADCSRTVSSMSRTGGCAPCVRVLRQQAPDDADRGHLRAEELVADLNVGRVPEPQDFSRVTRVSGDVALISDVHAPLHDARWLARMCEAAKKMGIRRLVLGGDFMDFSEISRFPRDRRRVDAVEALRASVALIDQLAKAFPEGIWSIKGNHELRLERLIHDATFGRGSAATVLADFEQEEAEALSFRARYVAVLDDWTRKVAPSAVGVVHWLPEAEIEIDGPAGERPWRVIHQRNGSRNATIEATNHWQRHQQPVICTHTHVVGMRLAPDGRTPLVNLGCATVEGWHEYAYREPGGYPHWQRSFGLIVGGRLTLYPDSPYLSAVG